MTRLGVYCPGNGTGGPWRYVHSILAALDPAEFDVTVFADLAGGYEPRPWVKAVRLSGPAKPGDGGATVPTAPPPAATKRLSPGALLPPAVRTWAGYGATARRLAKLIRPHRLDLLHTQNTGCEESPIAARLAGVPRVIGTFHVDSTYDLHRERDGFGHRLVETVSNRCLDVAIAVSHATKADWLKRTHLPASRIEVIHNGIDAAAFAPTVGRDAARAALGLPRDAVIVGGVGRLDEAKGFADLIAAAALLKAEFPALLVAVAGTGPLLGSLEESARRLGVADRVRFLGFQRDVSTVFAALDIFCLSSWCEALPYAVQEAMAAGLPVVGTRVGGVAEMVRHGHTGFVVPPRHPEALAGGLRRLLASAELRATLGAAGRARVAEEFVEQDMVARTLAVYRRLKPSRPGVA